MDECKKPNGMFTEISREYYRQLLENVPPKDFSRPYRDGGWFVMGEAYMHDSNQKAWHHLCFQHDGRYYWALRIGDIPAEEITREINEFCKKRKEL